MKKIITFLLTAACIQAFANTQTHGMPVSFKQIIAAPKVCASATATTVGGLMTAGMAIGTLVQIHESFVENNVTFSERCMMAAVWAIFGSGLTYGCAYGTKLSYEKMKEGYQELLGGQEPTKDEVKVLVDGVRCEKDAAAVSALVDQRKESDASADIDTLKV